jgi:hypothetical protein
MIAWLKTITPAQWRSIAVGILGLIVSSSSQLEVMGVPHALVPTVVAWAGFGVTALGLIGTILQSQSNQTANVVAHIDDPAVKAKIVPAVANLEGVKGIDVDLLKADKTLVNLAASTTPENIKITHS